MRIVILLFIALVAGQEESPDGVMESPFQALQGKIY